MITQAKTETEHKTETEKARICIITPHSDKTSQNFHHKKLPLRGLLCHFCAYPTIIREVMAVSSSLVQSS